MHRNIKKKVELAEDSDSVSLNNFTTKGSFSKNFANFRPSVFVEDERKALTDAKNKMHGIVNMGFGENQPCNDENRMNLTVEDCNIGTDDVSKQIEVWRTKNREIKENRRLTNVVHEKTGRPGVHKNDSARKIEEKGGGFHEKISKEGMQNGERGSSCLAAEVDVVESKNETNVTGKIKTLKEGIEHIRASDKEIQRLKEGNVANALESGKASDIAQRNGLDKFRIDDDVEKEENLKVVYKCRRNPPINPSIIVTTEPFDKIEKIRRAIGEESLHNTVLEDLNMVDNDDDEGVRRITLRKEKTEGAVRQGLAANEGKRQRNENLQNRNLKGDFYDQSNALPITEINDYNDCGDYDRLNRHPTRDWKANMETERKVFDSATPILNIDQSTAISTGNQSSLDRSIKSTAQRLVRMRPEIDLDLTNQCHEMLSKEGTNDAGAVYGYAHAAQQTNISEAVTQLRKKRNAFASRKNAPNTQSCATRSTESSLKSTDFDDCLSDVSIGRDELRGIFKNLNEQHKMIEKRSDALINFRPNNRCDTRLVSTAYEMASAMQQRRQSMASAGEQAKQAMKINTMNREDDNPICNNNIDRSVFLGLNVDMLETSKPSTNTSYFHDDGESLGSSDVSNKKRWSPSWIYAMFFVILWNSVVAFMHGIEGEQMNLCSRSIKWRLWCTIATCVIINFLLELLYEKKGGLRSIFSCAVVLVIILLANQHPLVCHGNGDNNEMMLNYLRAGLNISLAAYLFVLWLKTGRFSMQKKPVRFDGKKERKLSQLPISDFENR